MKRCLAIFSLAASLGAFASSASAQSIPTIKIVDTGPDAIIVADDLELASEAFKVRSNRIEVTLLGKPPAMSVTADDPTIAALGIRIRSTGERRLTITMKGGRDVARRLARHGVVRQVGDTIQVIIGRNTGTAPVAAFIEDVGELSRKPEPAASAEAPTVAKTSAPAKSDSATGQEMTTAAATSPNAPVESATRDEGSSLGSLAGLIFIFIAAIACGLGYREWQKRRPSGPPLAGIDVLSVKNVGPKTRLMLVAVGSREMLLVVGPSGSNVVGRWRRNDVVNYDDVAAPAAYRDDGLDRGDFDDEPIELRRRPQTQRPEPRRSEPARAARPIAEPPRAAMQMPPSRAEARPSRPAGRATNPAAAALARRHNQTPSAPAPIAKIAPVRRAVARGSSIPAEAAAEWNHRPTSPAIRGILELRDQSLNLDDVLGQDDDDIDVEWEQALAGGTRAGRLI